MIFEARPISLSTLFKNKSPFVIPDYQRNYKWDENTINVLLEDIYSEFKEYLDYDKKYPELQPIYFLGNIITISIDNKNELYNAFREPDDVSIIPSALFSVIDGQQRITTFSLIAITLHRKIREIYNYKCVNIEEYKSDIENVLKSLKCFFSRNISCTEESKPIILKQGEDKFSDKISTTKSVIFSYQENYINELNGQQKTNDSSTNSLEQHKWIDSKLADLFVNFAECFETDYNSPFDKKECRNEEIKTTMVKWNNYIKINNGKCTDQCSCFNKFREEDFRNNEDKISNVLNNIPEIKENKSKKDKKTINDLNKLITNFEARKNLENNYNDLPKCKIGKLKELLFYHLFAKYFKEYCQVVLIESKRIDFSYDIFQSLNAKGTPLTSIEVFNAYLSAKNDSDSSRFIKGISTYLDETKQESLVSDMLTDLAYVYNGNKLAERFKEQVDYLQKYYNENKEELINAFKNLYKYYLNYWLFAFSEEDQKNEDLIKDYKLTDIGEEALTCLYFLKESKHDKSRIALILFFIKCKDVFEDAIKAVTAFSILYRVIQGNAGLPNVYNDFMKNNNVVELNANANANTEGLLNALKDHLKKSLGKIGLQLPQDNSTPQHDIPLSFTQDEFKNDQSNDTNVTNINKLTITGLVDKLKEDKIIPNDINVTNINELNNMLSLSFKYKLYEKILCGKDDSDIGEDIKLLKNDYETDNTDEKQNKLKKLNRAVLEKFYPDVTPKRNNDDFNDDDFKDKLTITGLVDKLKEDKIIPNDINVTNINELNDMLSSSFEYKLYEKILEGIDNSEIDEYIKKLKEDYESDKKDTEKLKKLNRAVLEKFYPDVTPKSSINTNWLFMSDKKIAYKVNNTICKFCLFLYFDNQIATKDSSDYNNGLMTTASPSVNKYLEPDKWESKDLKELEHVAPQKQPTVNSGGVPWDTNIYTNNLQHDIGNLLLLPKEINISASNKAFGDKEYYYKIIADKTMSNRVNLITSGLATNIKGKTANLLLNANYISGLEPFQNLPDDFKWDLNFIKKRSEQIRKVVFNRLWEWLK